MERKESTSAKANPENEASQARRQLGADPDLLDLFGYAREGEDVAIIDSGRQEIFDQGIFTKDDLPNVDPRAIAVFDHGDEVFPAFQFTPDGTLRPEVAEVNRILKSTESMLAWEQAFWWISNNGMLDGLTPLAALENGDIELLLRAVRWEMDS